jgi:Aminoacyl-tRNA editing domain
VLEFEAGTRRVADAAAAIGCVVAEIAKSMIFCTVTSGRPVLVVASGDTLVDEKKAAAVIGEKIGNADFVRETTELCHRRCTARRSRAAAAVLSLSMALADAAVQEEVCNAAQGSKDARLGGALTMHSGDGRTFQECRAIPYEVWYCAIASTARVSVLLGCRSSSRIVK